MLEQFLIHLRQKIQCDPADSFLLAVSGGVDSMVMLDLFAKARFTFAVAHCNFQLRGADADADEVLVQKVCNAQNIPFHNTRFDTQAYAELNKVSIQVAARELRYDFFNSLSVRHGFRWIATAHHLNDSLETVLLNLTRGTGIDGLTGIPLKNKAVIRPLLFATRDQILQYAQSNNLAWREDKSNSTDAYARNYLRHHVIPLLKKLNPSLEEGFNTTLERISGTRALANEVVSEFISDGVKNNGDQIRINKLLLMKQPSPVVVLWNVLDQFHFSYSQCQLILQDHQSGKVFYSSTHQLTIDRDDFIVHDVERDPLREIIIGEDDHEVNNTHLQLSINTVNKESHVLLIEQTLAQLDRDKLVFPLRWRLWRQGDAFYPLGMNRRKKVSDFLIDNKVSMTDKPRVTILESNGEIVWVVGMRIDERFKITTDTKRVLLVNIVLNEGRDG